MSIGQTGKQAQQFGKRQHQRHHFRYQGADQTSLESPYIQRTTSLDPVTESPSSSESESDSTSHQSSFSSSSALVQQQPSSVQRAENDIQRIDTSSIETSTREDSQQKAISAEAIAERVYQLMRRDTIYGKEQRGKRFKA